MICRVICHEGLGFWLRGIFLFDHGKVTKVSVKNSSKFTGNIFQIFFKSLI